ncbi:Aste57867_7721 [Aphanomyces stellatus]|uniref:Aste57867_7721 protein n=1 Tax=Aphanomyces stellatus TaxID=120398 RepID=A0A485KIR6_9STRA|nr:hypothetical protein As57867_007692 [Aphanomyces stellatus]VFT84624.1 Aste57867_7721 [Aphanomyces stellatus]
MKATKLLKRYFDANPPVEEQIHVLVVVPEEKKTKDKWTALELSTIAPEVQWEVWKSVVGIVVKDSMVTFATSTALVVDRTSTHLYLLTNLHFFPEETYECLSSEFINNIKKYWTDKSLKKAHGKRKNDSTSDSGPSIPKSQRMKTAVSYVTDPILIQIEQLYPDEEALKKVHEFTLESDICWRSSVDFDFAILKIPLQATQLDLVGCKMAFSVYPTMPVHVFGFPGNLVGGKFKHRYAIIPAQVTGIMWNQMTLSTLSAPGLSGSAIVCTTRGTPVGYFGGLFDGSTNEQYQSYGFTLQGLPHDLPCFENETKEA